MQRPSSGNGVVVRPRPPWQLRPKAWSSHLPYRGKNLARFHCIPTDYILSCSRKHVSKPGHLACDSRLIQVYGLAPLVSKKATAGRSQECPGLAVVRTVLITYPSSAIAPGKVRHREVPRLFGRRCCTPNVHIQAKALAAMPGFGT